MKTVTCYIGKRGKNTLEFSNEYPDFAKEVRKAYWCRDFKSAPSLENAIEATYDDIEAYCEKNDIDDAILNKCK